MNDLPQEDRSTHRTVVEYAVHEMFKRKSPRKAAQATASRLSGYPNILLGSVVPLIDPIKLEDALWLRLVDNVLENIRRFKPGTEEIALGATVDHFRQGKTVEKQLRKLLITRLGEDPFDHSPQANPCCGECALDRPCLGQAETKVQPKVGSRLQILTRRLER